MGVVALRLDEARAAAVRAHGLDPNADVTKMIAESLRRAASVRCPSAPSALVAAVEGALAMIYDVDSGLVSDVLDQIIAVGDLVEAVDEQAGLRRRVLYLGSPRYVLRQSGDVLLLGVRPDAEQLVVDELLEKMASSGHVRRIDRASEEDVLLLQAHGLEEISEARWMKVSEPCDATELIERYDAALDRQSPSGEISGLQILDSARSASYYRGRWRKEQPGDSGRFVARRSQGYGSDLWCYVELNDGLHIRLLDLPTTTRNRGCDEAWHLQAAIDAARGNPQELILRRTGEGRVKLGLPAPPPRWLQRRWDLLGNPTTVRSALFSYEFSPSDTRDEVDFVKRHLWMTTRIEREEA